MLFDYVACSYGWARTEIVINRVRFFNVVRLRKSIAKCAVMFHCILLLAPTETGDGINDQSVVLSQSWPCVVVFFVVLLGLCVVDMLSFRVI